MAGPRRMTPEEHGEAHALLVKAVTDPDRQAANKALDDLMRKLVVVHRLLEAEERLPSASRGPTRCNSCGLASALSGDRSMTSVGGSRHGPPGTGAACFLFCRRPRARPGRRGNQVAVRARSHPRGVKGSRGSLWPPVWLRACFRASADFALASCWRGQLQGAHRTALTPYLDTGCLLARAWSP
jgi:hypothetical protein